MSKYVDLSERVSATFYNSEYEEWTVNSVTIGDILDSVCDDYPVHESSQAKGKWLEREVHGKGNVDIEEWQSAKCSACGRYHTTPYMYYYTDYNYCPNCGADMREEL